MLSRSKSVLLLQPLKFQAQVWRAALQSQQIDVIEEPVDIDFDQISHQLEAIQRSQIGLLLLDMGSQRLNAFDVCRWYHQHYPDLNLVLTVGAREKILSTEQRLAVEQGARDLFPGFHTHDLIPAAINRVRRILELLRFHPLEEKDLINALMPFCQGEIPVYQLPRPSQLLVTTPTRQVSPLPEAAQQTIHLSAPAYALSDDLPVAAPEKAPQVARQTAPKTSPFPAPLAPPREFNKRYLQVSCVALLMLVAGFWWWLRTPGNLSPALGGAELAPAADFQSVPDVPKGLFKYGGSAVWAMIRPRFETVMKLDYPNLRLQYVEGEATPGSGQGLRMLLAGQVDFIQSSRALKPAEHQAAQQQGFKLVEQPVAWDGIAVVVHPSLSVPGLSLPQLRQIYLGKITNWKQVGGPDRPIKAFSRLPEDSGTADYFQANVLQKSLGSKVVPVYSTTDAVRQLSNSPGGIYYASAAEVLYHCSVKPLPLGKTIKEYVSPFTPPLVPQQSCPKNRNQVNVKALRDRSYPITRRLYVIVKQDQGAAEQVGEAYGAMLLSEQGQQLIEQSGFARIN